MSRNGSGTYSKVNTFVAGNTITAAGHNQNWDDIAAEMTNSVAVDGQSTMTGPLKAASGTAAAPGITFGSDPDSGLYRIGANNIGVAVNGAKIIDVATTGATVVGDLNATTVKQNSFALLPVGVIFPYGGSSAPSGYLLCYGQEVSEVTYADLLAVIGTAYNTGGETAGFFRVPDLRGRVPAGQDDMGGAAASRLTTAGGGVNGATMGATGGAQNITLAANQIPSLTSTGSNSISVTGPDTGGAWGVGLTGGTEFIVALTGGVTRTIRETTFSSSGSNNISVSYTNGSQQTSKVVQPTIITNYIIFAGV